MTLLSTIQPATTSRVSRGFTLVEVIIAVALASMVLAVVGLISFYSSRSFVAMGNYVDLDSTSRDALDRMTREIRMTQSLSGYVTNRLTFVDNDGGTLVYEWDPNSRTLNRTKGGTTTVFLTECDYLKFGIYSRAPLQGSTNIFATVAANAATNCKLVDVTWKCSRIILGKKVNTESVQTAQVVIRNKQ